MWATVIDFLSSSAAPSVFCGIILLVFIYSLLDGWLRLSGIRNMVARSAVIIESAADTESFYEQFESIGDRLARETRLGSVWREFCKTIIVDSDRRLVRITRRPHEFFNASSVIAPSLNLRLYNAMPGYLISLGLFFTFIGLVAAIAIAANGLAKGADAVHTQAALVQLLQVASLKFVSSVAGISLSVILSFIQKTWLNGVTMRIHRFCATVERRTQLITTEQLLYQWLQAQERTVRGYTHLAEDVASEVILKLNQRS